MRTVKAPAVRDWEAARGREIWRGRHLVALMGAPGSGKSTLAAEFPAMTSTDSLRSIARLPDGSLPAGVSGTVYQRSFDEIAAALKANRTIVFDSPLTHADTRVRVLRLAFSYHAEATLIVLRTPVEVCIARQEGRSHPVPEARLREMHAELVAQYPLLEFEGWTRVDWR